MEQYHVSPSCSRQHRAGVRNVASPDPDSPLNGDPKPRIELVVGSNKWFRVDYLPLPAFKMLKRVLASSCVRGGEGAKRRPHLARGVRHRATISGTKFRHVRTSPPNFAFDLHSSAHILSLLRVSSMGIGSRQCMACLRRYRPLQLLRVPAREASSSAKPKWEEPEPRHIDEDTDQFDDVLGELHRRRKKMDAKRNRTVSAPHLPH